MSEINLSFWDIERIQREQDKHMSFKVTGVIPTVNPKQVENNLDALDSALDAYIRKVTEDTDMYIICEIAKLYIESQRPAEWIVYKDNYGNDKPVCSCCNKEQVGYANYCSYCGRRMKI